MDKKKIKVVVAAMVVFAVCFVAGFFVADKISEKKNTTDTDAEQETTAQSSDSSQTDTSEEVSEDEADAGELVIDHSLYEYLYTDEKFGSGELTVTEAEFLYYCSSVYDNLMSTSFQYDYYYGEGAGVMYTGFDYNKAPHEQAYSGEIEGVENPTYLDYIVDVCKEQLVLVESYVAYAELNGIELNEEEIKYIEDYIESVKETLQSEEGTTLDEYLKEYYGGDITEEIFINIVKKQYLLNKVDKIKSGLISESYTTEDIEKIYNEKIINYGTVTFRAYLVTAETETDSEGNEFVTDTTMAQAKQRAETFASDVYDCESFKQKAAVYEKNLGNEDYEEILTEEEYTLIEDVSYDNITAQLGSEECSKWAFSDETQAYDTFIFEREESGYVVCMMVETVHKISPEYTYDVRHILFQFSEEEDEEESGSENESEKTEAELLDVSAYPNAVIDIDVDLATTADPALYMEAQQVLIEYLEGDMTEEAFGELAKTYSSDGNAADGGIYEDVTEGYMVAPFEEWSLDENRKPGDVGIVETSYGYHIMYAVGKEVVSDWESIIREEYVNNDVQEFSTKLEKSYTIKIEGYTDEGTKANLAQLAEKNLEYYQSVMASY